MPPARRIHVDTDHIIATIASDAAESMLAALERTRWYKEPQRGETLALAEWVPRNLAHLAGYPLTPSERIRHQQAMRQLEADGLVHLDARHVRLSDAGKELAAKLKGASGHE